jgi:hypothetical protein
MKITESQLRRIIRNVIKENLSPADEFRHDTVGKTSYVDTVERSRQHLNPDHDPSKYKSPVDQARQEMMDKVKELENQGKEDVAQVIQDAINSAFDV